MRGRAVNTLWETVPLRSQRWPKSSALQLSGLRSALVATEKGPAPGVEPGDRRLMLELTALGKGQSCFTPGATSHPHSVVWGLAVTWQKNQLIQRAGSQLQDSLLSFLLPTLGCWGPTAPHLSHCAAASVPVATHPSGLVACSDCSAFATPYSYYCHYFH